MGERKVWEYGENLFSGEYGENLFSEFKCKYCLKEF
jgi:hypothetical protein